MTKQVLERTYGVDVAKGWLDIYSVEDDQTLRISNEAGSIERWLDELAGPVRLAVEATNRFHELLVESAGSRHHRVFVVDALKLSRYRDAVGYRAKTDWHDARLLARYLQQEQAHLACWQPRDPRHTRLWCLLKRRAALVKTKTRLRQSLSDLGPLDGSDQALIQHVEQRIRELERELERQAREAGWSAALRYSRSIPGVGPVSSLALVNLFHRYTFRSADAFIAFMGLDVRVRDSGTFRGRRKLTKKGDPEIRRLMYNAAMAACRQPAWKPYYRSLRDRGFSGTAALVALARKLARVCYGLLRQQILFDPNRCPSACRPT